MAEKDNWEVFKELNQGDIDNGTDHLSVGIDFLRGQRSKRGDEMTFGLPTGSMEKLMAGTHFALVLVVDRQAYDRCKKGDTDGK